MVPEIFYKYFCIIKKFRPDIKFIIAGDYAQLEPVKDRIGFCDYKNSWCLYGLVDGNRLQLTKCRRSDDKLFNMLLPKNIGNIKPSDFGNKFTERHITFTNKIRIKVNEIMMDRYAKTNQYLKLDKLNYDDNSQDVKLTNDTPIIARRNYKDLDIFNNEQFIIKKIEFNNENIIIGSELDEDKVIDIPFDMFQKLFYPAYAITIYKSQGSTFDHGFTIHEWGHPLFTERFKYVALSRAVSCDNINIYV
jgi:ATP-dependent exoDNAse (exonuclease V) alpha subunit